MASYSGTVSTPRPIDEVFAYLADFRHVSEWDPSISESTLVSDGEAIALGARFRVTTQTKLGELVLEYETTSLQPPAEIVVHAENDHLISHDTVTVREHEGGCEVTYEAQLELKGARRLADPLLELGFGRMGDRAAEGLAEKLDGTRR